MLKILFTPSNVASMPSFTIEALNKIEGIEARGIFLGSNKYIYQSNNTSCRYFDDSYKKTSLRFYITRLNFAFSMIRGIFWADVVHIIWGNQLPFNIDLWLCKLLNKRRFIEWVGSDIRIPEIAMKISRFSQLAYENPKFEYNNLESSAHSLKRQELFSKYGFIPITYSEMDFYLDRSLFSTRYFIMQRLNVSIIKPIYPLTSNKKPVVIHSPTAPIGKGTEYVIRAVELLKQELNFEFILVQNRTRNEALELLMECDVFLDQFIMGFYGLASCEAMSYGKPVVCYLSDEILNNNFPKNECPIINANIENLSSVLREIISDAQLRNDIGKKSRMFAEKYHNASVNALKLVSYYQEQS